MYGLGIDGTWHVITGEQLVHGPDTMQPTVACSAFDESVFWPEAISESPPDDLCEDCARVVAKAAAKAAE